MVGAHSTKAVEAAAIAVVSLLMSSPAGSTGSSPFPVVTSSGAMSDLSTSTADATDGARGVAISVGRTGRGTTVLLGLWGLLTASAGQVSGAHPHMGPCVGGGWSWLGWKTRSRCIFCKSKGLAGSVCRMAISCGWVMQAETAMPIARLAKK